MPLARPGIASAYPNGNILKRKKKKPEEETALQRLRRVVVKRFGKPALSPKHPVGKALLERRRKLKEIPE